MTSLTEFFNKHEDDALKGITHKNSIIKRNIIAHMAVNGECTLSELTKELHISVPTITNRIIRRAGGTGVGVVPWIRSLIPRKNSWIISQISGQ